MKIAKFFRLAILLLLVFSANPAFADIGLNVRTPISSSGQANENVIYGNATSWGTGGNSLLLLQLQGAERFKVESTGSSTFSGNITSLGNVNASQFCNAAGANCFAPSGAIDTTADTIADNGSITLGTETTGTYDSTADTIADDGTISSAEVNFNYANSNSKGGDALNADAVDGKHFNWSGQGGQPPWLWGGSDGTNMYVYNPSNFSVNYANSAGSANTAGNANACTNDGTCEFAYLQPSSVGGDSGRGAESYGIFQEGGPWSNPFPDLRIAYHTGIKIGAHYSYNGTRFYNNSDMVTELMSIGNTDNNVRIANNLYIGSLGAWLTDRLGQDVRSGSSPQFHEVYASSWFRNNDNNEGLYNQANGNHWYSDGTYWKAGNNNSGTGGIQLRYGHEGALKGYVYWDGSGFGLLSNRGNWAVRIPVNSEDVYHAGNVYGNWFYGGISSVGWNPSGSGMVYGNNSAASAYGVYGVSTAGDGAGVAATNNSGGYGFYSSAGRNYFNGATTINGGLTLGGGGNVVYGDNWLKTTHVEGSLSGANVPSGFYESDNPGDGPTSGWTHYLVTAHSGNSYQMLIAQPYWSDTLYTQRVDSGTKRGWRAILDSSNYSGYAVAKGGDVLDNIYYFRSNKGGGSYVGSNNSYQLEAYSTDGGAAGMSFHRSGAYAVNMGLDPDNVFRIGGWSASANRFQLDMSGNGTFAGNITANGGTAYIGSAYVSDSGNNMTFYKGTWDSWHDFAGGQYARFRMRATGDWDGQNVWDWYARTESAPHKLRLISGNSGTEVITFSANGNVGLGATDPGYRLHLSADSAGKPNGGSWANSSDVRLKKNFQQIDGASALEKLSKLDGQTFEWINPEEHAAANGEVRASVMAQNLREVFPQWVSEIDPAGKDKELIPEGDKALSISFPNDFNAYLIEAIKELKKQNEDLMAENDGLKMRIEGIENKLK